MAQNKKLKLRYARKARVRSRVNGDAERPRLTVFHSIKHVYVQVIDDVIGHTLISASTLDKDLAADFEAKPAKEKAKLVGALVAKRCLAQNITSVVFDRNGYRYHGVVKELADAAREGGLIF